MLNTLLKIGEWQSKGKSEWDRFLDYPKVEYKDKKGNDITNYTLPLIFDLDEMEVIVDKDNLKEYDEKDVSELKALSLIARNGKSFYVTVTAAKISQLYKTFFGKETADVARGELVEFIDKMDPSLLTNDFSDLLSGIFYLKNKFYEHTSVKNQKTNVPELNVRAIEERFELGKSENLILLTVMIKSVAHGFTSPVYFSEISEYQNFLTKQYFRDQDQGGSKSELNKKLCYASGELVDDVEELKLSERYSLNKMFVTETKNYASGFSEKKFFTNYQVSLKNQEKLDYASDFLLNHGYKVKIANVDHVIIPQISGKTVVDWKMALSGIKKRSDLLFHFDTLDHLAKDFEDETDDVFWINFIAFESDGNFFKSTEAIKDVSSFHFSRVIRAFTSTHWELLDAKYVDWDSVMTEYGKNRLFNFNSVYSLIPLRKDKEKKNKAMGLFKAILENRMVNKDILYSYFAELILCHWYERYGSYTNVSKSSKDYFRKTVRTAVFKYQAFIQVLKKLNLIAMEEIKTSARSETGKPYDDVIQTFIHKMSLNEDQQAMFYLGRLLNTVEYIQKDKKKTVIQKVNFNGMDKDDIQRLRIALIEKAKQYNEVAKVIFVDKRFSELFNYNQWNMSPQEAIFFLLTGYSFGAGAKETKTHEVIESEEENH